MGKVRSESSGFSKTLVRLLWLSAAAQVVARKHEDSDEFDARAINSKEENYIQAASGSFKIHLHNDGGISQSDFIELETNSPELFIHGLKNLFKTPHPDQLVAAYEMIEIFNKNHASKIKRQIPASADIYNLVMPRSGERFNIRIKRLPGKFVAESQMYSYAYQAGLDMSQNLAEFGYVNLEHDLARFSNLMDGRFDEVDILLHYYYNRISIAIEKYRSIAEPGAVMNMKLIKFFQKNMKQVEDAIAVSPDNHGGWERTNADVFKMIDDLVIRGYKQYANTSAQKHQSDAGWTQYLGIGSFLTLCSLSVGYLMTREPEAKKKHFYRKEGPQCRTNSWILDCSRSEPNTKSVGLSDTILYDANKNSLTDAQLKAFKSTLHIFLKTNEDDLKPFEPSAHVLLRDLEAKLYIDRETSDIDIDRLKIDILKQLKITKKTEPKLYQDILSGVSSKKRQSMN